MKTTSKEWYIVYTKDGAEYKVCEALRRKKLDTFYPSNRGMRLSYGREKWYDKPLLSRYVFVCMANEEKHIIKSTMGVVSLVHWKAEPVTVEADDIYLLKRFFTMHDDTHVEKIQVNPSESATIVNDFLSDTGVNNISLLLPVLGYVLTARQPEARVKVITVPGYQTKTKLQSEYAEER